MTNSKHQSKKELLEPLHIVFLHLDLGIGGAEQLILNLAIASLPPLQSPPLQSPPLQLPPLPPSSSTDENDNEYLNAKVSIFTTHCDQSHCFDAVRYPSGRLADSVHIVGSFIPINIFGYGTVFFSTIRMLYISFMARIMFPNADVFVLDVLPTPIPFLIWSGVQSVIYYCHFPDKLLTRDTVNGEIGIATIQQRGGERRTSFKNILKKMYRNVMDTVEEWSMSYADLCCLNSNFTKSEVMKAFPNLKEMEKKDDYFVNNKKKKNNKIISSSTTSSSMQVLYPAIDLSKFIPPDFESKTDLILNKKSAPIVSLNRFERKKNIDVLLYAYASLVVATNNNNNTNNTNNDQKLPPLIISGGYDPRNLENVEYLQELQALAKTLNIDHLTSFRPSISDQERAELLQSAICVVYTPFREHFGIVPLEAMYAGSAVVAGNNGGPMETVIHGETGILVDMKPEDDCSVNNLACALKELLQNTTKAIHMGRAGHEHVKRKFGLTPFRKQWKNLVINLGIMYGNERRNRRRSLQQRNLIIAALIFALLTIVVSKLDFIPKSIKQKT